jgi:hypothetical protein
MFDIWIVVEGKFVSIEKVNEKIDFFSNEALTYV